MFKTSQLYSYWCYNFKHNFIFLSVLTFSNAYYIGVAEQPVLAFECKG